MADSAYEVAATALKAIIDAEYDAEGFKAVHDHLHESLGQQRVEIGISPVRKRHLPGNASVDNIFIKIQFYGLWTREISPETQVNPFKVAAYQERLELAIEVAQATEAGTDKVWYFQTAEVDFPHDPTGNKSRFEMIVVATGDSPGLETRA